MAKTKKAAKKRVAKKRAARKEAVVVASADTELIEEAEAPVEEKAKESNGGRVVSRNVPKRIIGR